MDLKPSGPVMDAARGPNEDLRPKLAGIKLGEERQGGLRMLRALQAEMAEYRAASPRHKT